jgi:hypothetical protein
VAFGALVYFVRDQSRRIGDLTTRVEKLEGTPEKPPTARALPDE